MRGEIFVICTEPGKYDRDHILQLLSKANELASETVGSVTAVCMGRGRNDEFETLMEYGADKILLYECREPVSACLFQDLTAAMIERDRPEVILFPAAQEGKRLAAVLSTRFEAGLTADCIDIGREPDGDYFFSRAAMNDSVIAKIRCMNCDIKMATVKEGVFVKQKSTVKKSFLDRFTTKPELKDSMEAVWVLERMVRKKQSHIDIGKASVVFCIGRGVKQSGTYERICRLADLCGAEITATRAAVEELKISKERQVGQSGKSISPKLCISFGVSGASQHMVGIKNAEIVLAVNHDPKAPIFSYADYGIVEEIEAVVREMEALLAMAA